MIQLLGPYACRDLSTCWRIYIFTSQNVRSTQMADSKIALCFPCLIVVCASACTIYYIIRYYAATVYSGFWRIVGQATANEGSFVLPRWPKLGRQP